MRIGITVGLAALAGCVAAAPASAASSVVFAEGGNVVVASVDGKQRLALTTDGTPQSPYYGVAQAANGTTIAARMEQFDKQRPVLVKFAARDGAPVARNVMPAASFAQSLVAPIGMEIDDAGQTVAFGYSYCGIGGCIGRVTGYWLTFADHGPANPSQPQGSEGLYAPSFSGNRIVSSDGTKIMVQEAANAPFTDGHTPWIDPGNAGARFWGAEVAAGVRQIALEYSHEQKWGIVIARGDGTLGGATELKCFLPTTGDARDVSYSPDGSLIAWRDGEGVKVAGAPNLDAPLGPGDTCALSSPPVVISATGVEPNLGGADVAAMIAARSSGGGGGPDAPGGGGGGGGGQAAPSIALSVPRVLRLGKRVSVRVTVPAAGTLSATLKSGKRVVASGRARAARAGQMRVAMKLRRGVRARKLRGKRLVVRVTWTGASGARAEATARVRAR
jgi:hypothetical protein